MNKSIIYKAKEDKNIQEDLRKLKYLQKEPCEDAVSRQAAKRALEDRFMELQKRHDDKRYETNYCLNTILELPSVNPQRIGHWMLTDDDFVYCSECEDSYYPRPIDASWYYCPNCGAKMVEPQESEE